jgi:hypothetical protein
MSSTLSSARSWFSADPTKSSVDATLVPADPNVPTDPKNDRFPIKWPLFDRRISRAIAFLITFCFGVAPFSWLGSPLERPYQLRKPRVLLHLQI